MPKDLRIKKHPILTPKDRKEFTFYFNDIPCTALEGEVISSSLFAGGYTLFGHHYLDGSPQGIFCANGQCSQCLVLADGMPVKACMEMTRPGMKVYSMEKLPVAPADDRMPGAFKEPEELTCDALIIGGGPSGIAAAAELGKRNFSVILVDDKDSLGGKLVLQTHKFFGSIDDCYAGTRGIDIARILVEELEKYPSVKVLLKTTALGVFADKKVGLLEDGKKYLLVSPKKLLVAAGAREKALAFPGCDLPGVYGAGAFQTLLNRDLVKPSRRLFVIGGGNVGVIAAYHALQAGIKVVGLAEALPKVSGYKVHADKLVRLGTPIYTSHSVVRADGDDSGVKSVTICRVDEKFKVVPDTEKTFLVDTVLIAVGLTPVNEMYEQAQKAGIDVYSAGDAQEIAEASAAMFSGRIAGSRMAKDLGAQLEIPHEWQLKMEVLKSRPGRNIETTADDREDGVFPVFHCSQEIPCNPCTDICPQHGIVISDDSIMGIPSFEGQCTGCSRCVAICPGLAVTLVDYRKSDPGYAVVSVPLELIPDFFETGSMVPTLDKEGRFLCQGEILSVASPKAFDRTLIVKLKIPSTHARKVAGIRLLSEDDVKPAVDQSAPVKEEDTVICRCMRVYDSQIRTLIRQGVRDMNQIKALLNAGMGACGGKTCKQLILRMFREEGVPESEVTSLTYRSPEIEAPLGVFAGIEKN